jgi:outer membrane protein TolC
MAALALLATPPSDDGTPFLALEDAIAIAERENHQLASTARQVGQADERAAALRTRRLPALRLDAFGGRLLNSPELTIPAGSLGTVPGLGPFPTQDSPVELQDDFGVVAMVSASQPLTQQYRIGLGIDAARLDRHIATQEVRQERHRVAAEVRTTYYEISATEAGIEALRDLVRSVEEVDAVTTRHLEEGVVLRSDALEVKARVASERQRLAAAESGLATQRERLNQLLGRDVATPFRVAKPFDLSPRAAALTLEAAREHARGARPEIRSLSLRAERADTARRAVNAGWIPDVSLTASYARLENFDVLPDDVATVGLYLTWEPFDWGRKRHEARERSLQKEQALEGRSEAQQQIEVEVGHRWRALKDAAALLEAMRLEEEASTASLETDRNRYRENATILRDLLRTEARLSAARHGFTDALAGYWSAAAELERAIGNEN